MATRIITLEDGTKVEAEVMPGYQIADGDTEIEKRLDEVKPLLIRATHPVIAAWREINKEMVVEEAEIELGLGIEASGNFFLAQAKGSANIKIKLKLKPVQQASDEQKPNTAG